MENKKPRHSSGFLFGAILGAAAVFFLATPQGKKIVKMVSENGLESILSLLNDDEDENEAYQNDAGDDTEYAEEDKPSNKPHRFFKGISRRR